MGIRITGLAGEMKRIKAEIRDHTMIVKKLVGIAVKSAVQVGMSRTPVFSGEAVRNYKVGVGSIPSRTSLPVQGRVAWPPSGPLPPDTQNEQRRGANEAAVMAEVSAKMQGFASMRKMPDIVAIKNTSDIADLIENGSAPTAERSRYAGGVSILMRNTLIRSSKGTIS